MHSAARAMRLHMTIWLYKSVYLERKHERDVCRDEDRARSSEKKTLEKSLIKLY